MASYRPARVGELIQAELATLLTRGLKDPRLEMSTVSYVEVTSDLRHARVYISRLGSEAEQDAMLQGFQRAAGFIRGQLGRRLKLRYIPQLTFELDTGIAYGVRISSMLNKLTATSATEESEAEVTDA
ncbi:MAG TPA: 30S ribosome-binding factor RbfA [Candidatus Entotheonella sp.]|jgi:ribosome-binding factor A